MNPQQAQPDESTKNTEPALPNKNPVKPSILKILKHSWVFQSIIIAIGLVLVFYIGYELAIYQTQKNDKLLPHISFTSEKTNDCAFDLDYAQSQNDADTISCDLFRGTVDKPVIYLYPTHTENVNVQVSYKPGFTKTVPNYNENTGWEVRAQPNGTLYDLFNNKTYPYLFWEGNPDPSLHFDMTKGFVVSGNDTKNFLEHQLTTMGLNQSETAAYVTYWLPKMQNNPYNLIHFAGSEYTDVAKLTISPQPDSLLRVFMAYEPLQDPVRVTPQVFPTFQRLGFTAVEWGGTELSN